MTKRKELALIYMEFAECLLKDRHGFVTTMEQK